jgi:hypothetical protein
MAADDVIDEQAMSPIGPRRTRWSATAAAFGGKADVALRSRRGS